MRDARWNDGRNEELVAGRCIAGGPFEKGQTAPPGAEGQHMRERKGGKGGDGWKQGEAREDVLKMH